MCSVTRKLLNIIEYVELFIYLFCLEDYCNFQMNWNS